MQLVIDDENEPPLFNMTNIAYMKRKIDENEDVQKADLNKNTIAARVRRYFEENQIDKYIDVINGIVSFMFSLTFMIGTYYNERDPNTDLRPPEWLKVVEIVSIFILTIDFLLGFFIAENRLIYVFST